jgi:ParB family chromosome partitioning protein
MKENVHSLRTDMIRPNLRLSYNRTEIDAFSHLMHSGTRNDPITVLFDGEHFRIIDGEKRWRAARKLGLTSIEAVIEDLG